MENIGEILHKNQPEPLTILNSKKCRYCGKEFEDRVFAICIECREEVKERDKQEQIKQYKEYLEEAKDKQFERWAEQCNIPAMFCDKNFEDFKQELQSIAYNALENYKEGSLILLSPGVYGLGKTHLVCALANKLIQNGEPAYFNPGSYNIRHRLCPVHFNTEQKILNKIRGTYNRDSDESEEDVYGELLKFRLLIIDDVGKLKPRDLSFLQSVYYRIVDDFYTSNQDIIMTTNLSLKELEEHIGGASADRLREMCGKDGIIKMEGKSYRKGMFINTV